MVMLLTLEVVSSTAMAGDVTIAAASDLSFAFKEMIAAYEQQTGHQVKLSLGSSGNFFSQIQNGAPFDLYFSADIRYPQKLVESGHALADSLYAYAIGRIVVWVPNGSRLDVEGKGLAVLADPALRKIALANPKHAPYGRAAVAAFEHEQLYETVKDRLVFGENVSQAAQFVQSGAADAGVIALSLAKAPVMLSSGRYWEVPAEFHPPLEQGAVLVKASRHQDEARSFLQFLQSARGQDIMTRYGFVVPGHETGR
jgi:molybdate transport system substrate-binding protein